MIITNNYVELTREDVVSFLSQMETHNNLAIRIPIPITTETDWYSTGEEEDNYNEPEEENENKITDWSEEL